MFQELRSQSGESIASGGREVGGEVRGYQL